MRSMTAFGRKCASMRSLATFKRPSVAMTRRSLSGGNGAPVMSVAQQVNQHQQQQGAPRVVGYWLLGMSGLVAGMVAVGGITRLTRSGLSMTDWKLQGSMFPITKEDWEREFDRYKLFPEWQQRKSMTLDEFKFIFFWEYGHRMMGRFIGIAFTAPLLYFGARGMVPRSMYPRMALLFTLGGSQGLIGWWMVKSGLDLDPTQKKEIRVSPYRLATHLSMAFTTYTVLLWTGLGVLYPASAAQAFASTVPMAALQKALALRRFAIANGLLVATTVVSGAYVAGNDAGRAFNSFPMMNDEWIPSEILEMKPLWRNFFENTATVQFDHRVLALSTLASIATMYASAQRAAVWSSLPVASRTAFHLVAGTAVAQVSLGIATLLLYVPIPLAATHQFGSLTLLTFVTALAHTLNYSKYGRVAAAAAASVAGSSSTLGAATTSSARAIATALKI